MFNFEREAASTATEIKYVEKRTGWLLPDRIADRNIATLHNIPTQYRVEEHDSLLRAVSAAGLWLVSELKEDNKTESVQCI